MKIKNRWATGKLTAVLKQKGYDEKFQKWFHFKTTPFQTQYNPKFMPFSTFVSFRSTNLIHLVVFEIQHT